MKKFMFSMMVAFVASCMMMSCDHKNVNGTSVKDSDSVAVVDSADSVVDSTVTVVKDSIVKK